MSSLPVRRTEKIKMCDRNAEMMAFAAGMLGSALLFPLSCATRTASVAGTGRREAGK